jgi:tetratricopeptide (TPR) repeat protein
MIDRRIQNLRHGIVAAGAAVALLASAPGHCGTLAENEALCGVKLVDPSVIDACTAVIQSDQASKADIAEAYMIRGLAHRLRKQFPLALGDLTSSIELSVKLSDRNNLTIEYVNRGDTYLAGGSYQDAISDYQNVIALDPRLFAGYQGLGNVYQDIGRYEAAVENYSKAIGLEPEDPILYYCRAISYQAEGKIDQAIMDNTETIDIILRAGTSSQTLGRYLAGAYHHRALSFLAKGDAALALPDAEEAVTLSPENSGAIETRAEIYERLGRRDDAVAGYRAALRLQPDLKAAKNGLGRLGATQ